MRVYPLLCDYSLSMRIQYNLCRGKEPVEMSRLDTSQVWPDEVLADQPRSFRHRSLPGSTLLVRREMIPISPLSTISARAMSGRNPEDDVAMSSGRAGYIAS